MMFFFTKRYSLSILILISIFTAIGLFYNLVSLAEINPDAGMYLTHGLLINDGVWPYADIQSGYTPFVYFIYAFTDHFFGNSYTVFSNVNFAFTAFNGMLVSRILNTLKVNFNLSLVAVLTYFLLLSSYEAQYIVLEPFVLFFSLLCILFLINEKYLWVGVCITFAFLCKQYGIFICLSVVLTILTMNESLKYKVKSLLIAGGCSLFTLLIFIFVYIVFSHASLEVIIESFYNSSYGERSASVFFTRFYSGVIKEYYFIIIFPFFLCINESKRVLVWMLSPALFFCLQLYFRNYLHYYILIYPFCILVYIVSINRFMENRKKTPWPLVLLLLTPLIYPSLKKAYKIYDKTQDSVLLSITRYGCKPRDCQINFSKELQDFIPFKDVNVFNNLGYAFVYLNRMTLPLMSKYGIGFSDNFRWQDLVMMLQDSSYIIDGGRTHPNYNEFRVFLENKFEHVKTLYYLERPVEIWKKRKAN